jgi:hypothetical protein
VKFPNHALRLAYSRSHLDVSIPSSGSYPERLENAAQSELPVGCFVAFMRPAEAGYSRGEKPREYQKAESRGG